MRVARINKQKMKYSLLVGKTTDYTLDKDGNKIVAYTDSDGTIHYQEKGKPRLAYSLPVEFMASISLGGTNVDIQPFGISNGEYDATMISEMGLPLTETSLVWHKNEVKYLDSGHTIVDPSSADYTVAKVTPSLNVMRYELKAVVK